MFKFLKVKQNKQLKKKSEIVSCKFIEEYNLWNNILNNPYTMVGYFSIIGTDGQSYEAKAVVNDMRSLSIAVYKLGDVLLNIGAYGKFNTETEFYLERIENKNPKFKGYGWGTILMICMLQTLKKYCELNNYNLKRIYGTIGVGGGDTPEKSMPLYLSFDNYIFDEFYTLHLQKQGFNIKERKLEFLIA